MPDPDPYALYTPTAPFNPSFMREAVRALFRTLPIDPDEPKGWADRRMHSALLALSTLLPTSEIEVMLGVQALSAYHAAAACWRIGMNRVGAPNGDGTRHITTACTAARTFDTMLRAIERRQAKPRPMPEPRTWENAPTPCEIVDDLTEAVRADEDRPIREKTDRPEPVWTPEMIESAKTLQDEIRIERENEGLDIANTEGILPGGGMILMEDPTPQQAAYMGRRLGLMYKREIAENRRNGITKMPKIRPIRPGDLIP